MLSWKSPRAGMLVRGRNQFGNTGSRCNRKTVVRFLYSRGILVLTLIAFVVVMMQISSFRPDSEPEPVMAINDQHHGDTLHRDQNAPRFKWQPACDLSIITDVSNLTTLVIMAYLNHDALMMVISKYNDCRHFGGLLHEIVRYTPYPFPFIPFTMMPLHL